jgi:hypothetical protein
MCAEARVYWNGGGGKEDFVGVAEETGGVECENWNGDGGGREGEHQGDVQGVETVECCEVFHVLHYRTRQNSSSSEQQGGLGYVHQSVECPQVDSAVTLVRRHVYCFYGRWDENPVLTYGSLFRYVDTLEILDRVP